MIKDISIVIMAKDAQDTIEETLESLKVFPEVILYLNNSSDQTETIAKSYPNVKIIQGEFLGFGKTKNMAASHATNTWVFSLDSDEIIPPALQKELESLSLENPKALFRLKRANYFLGKEVKHSGWGKDWLVRLYNKEHHSFNDNQVHEFIPPKDDSLLIDLKNPFKHNAVQNINQFLEKIIRYSDLAAKDKKTCFFSVVILKSLFAFVKTYFLQLGFLDGWRGFVISTSNFNGKFFRYTKRYIHCKQIKK